MLISRVFRLFTFQSQKYIHLTLQTTVKACTSVLYRTHKMELKPPQGVQNMQKLDRSLFLKQILVPYIKIQPSNVSRVIKPLKKYLLKLERFRPVHDENGTTLAILNPLLVKTFENIEEIDRQNLAENGITKDYFDHKEIELTFDNYSTDDIFQAILPADKEGMASFTKIGHIVHVNLRDHLLPFKELIGEVLLDKVAACRTVVNKINIIDNTYRNFKMEVLAGEEDFMVTLKENRCIFEFDFSKVYWNSRLCTEHERIAKMIKKDEVLFDVFAGVGPFSIPASKDGAVVFANDLNPESFRWLQHNCKKNKIKDNLQMFNKDGKDFILEDVKLNLITFLKEQRNIYITMNLPALASEFLKYFEGLYCEDDLEGFTFKPPVIYLYCFAKGEETEAITRKLIDDCMSRNMSGFVKELFQVRTVSNFKEMMRVKISLEKEILLGKCDEETAKRKLVQEDSKFGVALMGKNKKKNNVFKVAGAKSFKSKQKAKVVNTKLKDIKVKVKEQIDKMDKDLLNVQDKLHQTTPTAKKKETTRPEAKFDKAAASKDFEKMKTDKEALLNDMENFNLTK